MLRKAISTLSVSILLAASTASISSAQPAEGQSVCGLNSPDEFMTFIDIFLGKWSVKHLEGVAIASGQIIPFPASPDEEIITITMGDGMLVATHPEMQKPMEIGRNAGELWGFMEEGQIYGLPMSDEITEDVVENMAGCNLDELPNLLGLTTVQSQGVVMHFAWFFTVVDVSNMIVAQHITANVNGIQMVSRRMVQLTAVGSDAAPVPMPEMDFKTLPEMNFTFE